LPGNPPPLLRHNIDELGNMNGPINAVASANSHMLVYGDFKQGMVIVDEVGA
jgi:predicted phage gp36 major capsid-like protein